MTYRQANTPAFIAAVVVLGLLGAVVGQLLAEGIPGWPLIVAVFSIIVIIFAGVGIFLRRRRSRRADSTWQR